MVTKGITVLKNIIETNPLWYQDDQIKYFINLFNKNTLTKREKSDKNNFKTLLKETIFYIDSSGYNWDQWRLPIEYAVIHHTSRSPTIGLKELNVLGLRLYIQQYLTDKDVKDQPLYSGHYWVGQPEIIENMTFVSYHFLVRPNGKIIQLTDTSAYLWHAGNLEINRKSIGIALAGKFIDKEPTAEALISAASIIKKYNIDANKVFGHKEVIKKDLLGETECPGNLFSEGWKSKLIFNL